MKKISIIVPTYNEESNIIPLIQRVHQALRNAIYEIIFVDDHSKDNTQYNIIRAQLHQYPIRLYIKKGTKGKAQSLIEGFTYATGDLICMIDADLQYPPEAIPEMLKKIEAGADMVIGILPMTR